MARYAARGKPMTQYDTIKIGVVTPWYPAPTMIPAVATCTASMTMNHVSVGTNASSLSTTALSFVYTANTASAFA